MTKDEAIKLLPKTSSASAEHHQEQIDTLFKFAEALRQDYVSAKNSEEKGVSEFLYFRHLEEIDARLTLIGL